MGVNFKLLEFIPKADGKDPEYPNLFPDLYKDTIEKMKFEDPNAIDMCESSNLPTYIELSAYRDEKSSHVIAYVVNAFNMVWYGENAFEVFTCAMKDIMQSLLTRREECAKLRNSLYDQSIMTSTFKLKKPDTRSSKIAIAELHRQKHEALPENFVNVETLFDMHINPDIAGDGSDPEIRDDLSFCDSIGIIPGVNLRKADVVDSGTDKTESVYIADAPFAHAVSTTAIDALGTMAFDLMYKLIQSSRTIRSIKTTEECVNNIEAIREGHIDD